LFINPGMWAPIVVEIEVAFVLGMQWLEEDGGRNARLARMQLVPALIVPSRNNPAVLSALRDLGLKRPPSSSQPDAFLFRIRSAAKQPPYPYRAHRR
jgi:hypothetical protein